AVWAPGVERPAAPPPVRRARIRLIGKSAAVDPPKAARAAVLWTNNQDNLRGNSSSPQGLPVSRRPFSAYLDRAGAVDIEGRGDKHGPGHSLTPRKNGDRRFGSVALRAAGRQDR